MNNNKILVIGGSGFLGSHVADALSDAGYQVKIFDRQALHDFSIDNECILLEYSALQNHVLSVYS